MVTAGLTVTLIVQEQTMRAGHVLIAGFVLASAIFVTTMLVAPPTSKAAATTGNTAVVQTPLVLVGP